MRVRITALLMCLAGLATGAQGPSQGAVVPAGLAARVALGGSVAVVVGVKAPLVPEGDLPAAAAIAVQRSAIARAVQGAATGAVAAGIDVGRRFEQIPFFTARVDAQGLAALSALPGVASIEEDAPEHVLLADSVPLIGAPAAWAAGSTGAGWTVALLDTGVDTTHSFLAGKVTSEACFSNAGGTGSGTPLCPGGSTTSTDAGSGVNCDPDIADCEHGTHLAGIIAGSNGPGGMSGVAPGASIMAIQVFTRGNDQAACGIGRPLPCIVSYPSDQAAALEHVLARAGAGNANRIAAVNLSLGGGRYTDTQGCITANPSRAAGISQLRSIGIASVGATGNDGYANAIAAPACLTTIAVGSTTKGDQMSGFSNRSFTPIVAPGEGIVSSLPGGLFAARSGTSIAAAHVSGALAILKQAVPAATVSQEFVALSQTGRTVFDPATGANYFRIRIDSARASLLAGGNDVPGPPGRPTATVSGNTVTVSWTPPSAGGSVSDYVIEAGSYSGATNIGSFSVGATTSVTASPGAGLYYIRVRARNNFGLSDPSIETFFAIGGSDAPPGTPGPLTATVTGGSVTLSWSPPTFGPPPTHYVLQAGTSPGNYTLASLNVGNLTSFTATPPAGIYYVRVLAANDAGTSTYAAATSFAIGDTGRPGTPGTPVATVSGSSVTVSWTPPTTGSVPTTYLIAAGSSSGASDYGVFSVGPGTSVTATPSGGTYFISVIGVNQFGAGLPSAEISFTIGGLGAGVIDGTWNGQTALGQSVAFVVQGGVITQFLVGNAAGSCVRYRNDAGLRIPVSGGSFTRTVAAGPRADGYTISGTIASPTAASGGLASVMTAGSCGGTAAAAWTATNSGIGFPILPLAPSELVASPGPSTATFAWHPPDPVGGQTTSYDLEIGTTSGASNVAVLASTETGVSARGLAAGTYFARVRARNRSGTSRPSNEVTFTVSATAPSYAGTWSGTTSQAKPFTMVVSRVGGVDVVSSLTFGFTITGAGGCTLDDQVTVTPGPGVNLVVSGNTVTMSRLVDPPTFAGSGTFSAATSASGNLNVTSAISSPCVGSAFFSWTATKP